MFVFSGCPSSCKCDEFGEGQSTGKRIMVAGEDLLTVPTDLPSNTGAMYVTTIENCQDCKGQCPIFK